MLGVGWGLFRGRVGVGMLEGGGEGGGGGASMLHLV